MAAAAHLAVTLPAVPTARCSRPFIHEPVLECDLTPNPLRDELAPPPFAVVEGRLTPSSRPGLGIDIDRDTLARFAV
jgi:L-alanine-DL-glutamate epimerase-like enolase superfamily enzyme